MTTYYITGITGHLGRNLVKVISSLPFTKIVGLVLTNDNSPKFDEEVTLVEGNILDFNSLDKFLNTERSDTNYLIHCAGLISTVKKDADKIYKINVDGTKNVLDRAIANKIDKFVYVSSVDAIKKPPIGEPVVEPDGFNPDDVIGAYGKSKAIAASYVLSKKEEIHVMSVHPSAMLGPNDYFKGPINDTFVSFMKGRLKVIPTGAYDLVDVRDVAQGIVYSLDTGKNGECYILSGHFSKEHDMINTFSEASGKGSYWFILPAKFVKVFIYIYEGFMAIIRKKPKLAAYSIDCLLQNCRYNSNKAHTDFGYIAREGKETFKDTLEWIKEVKWIK